MRAVVSKNRKFWLLQAVMTATLTLGLTACGSGLLQDALTSTDEGSDDDGVVDDGGVTSCEQTGEDLVFVAAGGSDQIFTVAHDCTTGALEILATTDYVEDLNGNDTDADSLKAPQGLAVHPNGRWLYAANFRNWNDYGSISGWEIDHATGALSPLALTENAGEPLPLMDYSSIGTSDEAQYATPVTLAFSSDGSILTAQDDSMDMLRFFQVDQETGALTELEPSDFVWTNGHRQVAHPSLNIFYQGGNVSSIGDSGLFEPTDMSSLIDYWTGASLVNIGGVDGILTINDDGLTNLLDITDPMAPVRFSGSTQDLLLLDS